jgi:hypothetical protein
MADEAGRDGKGRFAPGNKLSPGAPKKPRLWIKEELLTILDELVTIGEEGKEQIVTRKQAILRAAVEQAEQGDARAREWISDRTDGKVREVVETEAEDRVPVRVLDMDESVESDA